MIDWRSFLFFIRGVSVFFLLVNFGGNIWFGWPKEGLIVSLLMLVCHAVMAFFPYHKKSIFFKGMVFLSFIPLTFDLASRVVASRGEDYMGLFFIWLPSLMWSIYIALDHLFPND